MKSPAQEIAAQLFFWSGIGCLPLMIAVFIAAFRTKKVWIAVLLLAVGSAAATHFMWYFTVLGGALGTKVGEYHPPAWWSLYPTGLAIALLVAVVRALLNRRRRRS